MATIDNAANTNWALMFACWLIASVSALGSLFFSAVMEFPPCVLCWYQRIFMFPLVIIFLIGLFPFDKKAVKYGLPLALIGWGFAFYHQLVYAGLIPESIQPCTQGVSCTERYLDMFGFITIPMLSLVSFSVLVALLIILRRRTAR